MNQLLNSQEFNKFVSYVRTFEEALGDGRLTLNREEIKYRNKMLKVVVANKNIDKFENLKKTDLSLKSNRYKKKLYK